MGFFSTLFGGPSSQEANIATQQQVLGNQQQQSYQQQLQSAIGQESQIASQLNPIAAAGPSQMGWSPQLASAVSTQNINAAAAADRNARQAVGAQLAGQGGGGTSGLTGGIQQQIAGTIASNAENNLSNSQLQATEANAAQGNANWLKATAGEEALAGQEAQSAGQFSGQASNTNQAAFGEANTVNSQKGSVLGDIGKLVGLAGGAVGSFVTGGLNNLSGDSSFGENVGNFFSGGVGNVFGNGTGTPGAGQNALSGNYIQNNPGNQDTY